jgi:aminopeptidase N
MENWGCITFLNKVFLSSPSDTSAEMFQRNARTVTHEVSHMWFGNLVTMRWWDDIWLNEGFARFAEHQILSELRPEYNSWEKYHHKVFKVAIEADKVLQRTHPVILEVPDAD